MSLSRKAYEVSLNDGRTVFALTDQYPLVRFFRSLDGEFNDPIFACWVHKSAYRSAGWKLLRGVEMPDALIQQPVFFKNDLVAKRVDLYLSPKEIGRASPADIDQLEPAAVWEAHDLASRISDALDGRPNYLVESMRKRARELAAGPQATG